jgi:hypothetical protein
MHILQAAGLLTDTNEPVCPELFWGLAAVWRRTSVAMARLPEPGRSSATDALGLGLEDVANTVGWALTDTNAAVSWGMPVVARGDYPPDFYVPDSVTLRRATALLGVPTASESRRGSIAVAPVPFVCRSRVDHSLTSGEIWPVANHVVVALDLAQDLGRGTEVLDEWHPEAVCRVW